MFLGIGGELTAVTNSLDRMSVTDGQCIDINGGADEALGLAASNSIGSGEVNIGWGIYTLT